MRFATPTAAVAFAVLLAGCQSAETPQQAEARIAAESNAARPELDAIATKLEGWYPTAGVDSAATLLTEDHSSMPPNQPGTSGRAAWIKAFKPVFATMKVAGSHVTESVVANGPLAVQRGSYVLTFTPLAPAGAKSTADTGKFVWQWRKVDGKWQMAAAVWNSNLPVQK